VHFLLLRGSRNGRQFVTDNARKAKKPELSMTPGGIKPILLPARSPNLNAFAERWVRSVKQECLSKLILFGEASLRRALGEFVVHFHAERNHQGKGNVLLFPSIDESPNRRRKSVFCTERLGGLLKYYCRAA
jgi:transposase InsO family protein